MSRFALHILLAIGCLSATASAQFQEGHIFVGSFDSVVYEIDPVTFAVTKFADSTSGLAGTSAVAFTPAHTLLTSNYFTSEVIEFDASGTPTVVLDSGDGISGPFGENGIAIDQSGRVYVGNFDAQNILQFQSDYTGGSVFADSADGVVNPDGLAFLASGDLFVANRGGGGTVLRIAPNGATAVFDTIPGEDCFSIAVRNNGDIYVGCSSGNVFRYVGGSSAGRVLLGTFGFSNLALEFNPGQTALYVTTSGDASLWKVDPDTGAGTAVVVGTLTNACGIAVFGSECPPGNFTEYGTGLAGSGGFVPALHGTGHPAPGFNVTLEVRDFVGGASSVLLLGLAPDSLSALGGTIYVSFGAPFFLFGFSLPGGGGVPGDGDVDVIGALPNDPALRCLHLFMQWFANDSGAPVGVSMSNALDMFIGD